MQEAKLTILKWQDRCNPSDYLKADQAPAVMRAMTAEIMDLRSAIESARVGQNEDSDLVTRESAIQAIEFVHQHNGPGREVQAINMLLPVSLGSENSAEDNCQTIPLGWRNVPRLPLPVQLRQVQHLADVEVAKDIYLTMVDAAPKFQSR